MLSLSQGRLQGRRLRGSILSVTMHMLHAHARTHAHAHARARARARRRTRTRTQAQTRTHGGEALSGRGRSPPGIRRLETQFCQFRAVRVASEALSWRGCDLYPEQHTGPHTNICGAFVGGARPAHGIPRRHAPAGVAPRSDRPSGRAGPRNDADAGSDCDANPPKGVCIQTLDPMRTCVACWMA